MTLRMTQVRSGMRLDRADLAGFLRRTSLDGPMVVGVRE